MLISGDRSRRSTTTGAVKEDRLSVTMLNTIPLDVGRQGSSRSGGLVFSSTS